MTRDQLSTAAQLASEAAESTDGDAADRLRGLSDQLADLAARDRGPDHGRLARILNAFDEVEEEVDDGTAETIERARTEISDYREGVEGV